MHNTKWIWVAAYALFLSFFLLAPVMPVIGSGIQQLAYQLIQDEGSNLNRTNTLNFTGAGVNCTNGSGKTNCDISGTSGQLHSITFVINGGGSAITTGALNIFPTADFACTINRIDVSGNPSGSITVDIWKAAGAIPTSGNKISASAPATLSSSQLNQNGSLTGWTTAVNSGDVFGGTVATASTVTSVTVTIWCQ
jgi:hypothetical protein